MRRHGRLVLAGLTVSLLMGFAVSSASANRFSVSNTKFRATWTKIILGDPNGVVRIECPTTLEGSFHSSTIRKVRGALVGAITRGIVKTESCVGGSFMILREHLPWHLTYESFVGTLPNIIGVQTLISRYAVQLRARVIVEITCLYADLGDPEENLTATLGVEAGGAIVSYVWDESRGTMRFLSGSGVCPQRQAVASSQGVFQLLGTTTLITLRLI
jgi:hypothetical protein